MAPSSARARSQAGPGRSRAQDVDRFVGSKMRERRIMLLERPHAAARDPARRGARQGQPAGADDRARQRDPADAVADRLRARRTGQPRRRLRPGAIGAMIEIPAAALSLRTFLKYFDFLSIGTNDLIQYTLAIDRADESVAHLYDPAIRRCCGWWPTPSPNAGARARGQRVRRDGGRRAVHAPAAGAGPAQLLHAPGADPRGQAGSAARRRRPAGEPGRSDVVDSEDPALAMGGRRAGHRTEVCIPLRLFAPASGNPLLSRVSPRAGRSLMTALPMIVERSINNGRCTRGANIHGPGRRGRHPRPARARVGRPSTILAVLRACIPGCEELVEESPTVRRARVLVKVGPVRARFDGRMTLGRGRGAAALRDGLRRLGRRRRHRLRPLAGGTA